MNISLPALAFNLTGGHEYAMLIKKHIQNTVANWNETENEIIPPVTMKSRPNNQRPSGTGGGESR
ncbi:hypothetical protein SCALIN_C17_0184 [Candidatus Scalindua japonica]|uniref:Uncharacterized protein n=1 Tax=Candidatus Scalindua japonica TaxID=1284222 RepID=A0A286TZ47_9BACT|nr:hypothetical protein SCALIN_C17_0184 [Candidatus Scalindua japonica]